MACTLESRHQWPPRRFLPIQSYNLCVIFGGLVKRWNWRRRNFYCGRAEVREPRILYKLLIDLNKWHCPYIYTNIHETINTFAEPPIGSTPWGDHQGHVKSPPCFGTKAIQLGEIGPSEVQRLSTSLSPFDCSVAHSAPLQKSHHFSVISLM